MIENSIPTNLDLNGPIISFIQTPVGVTTIGGTVQFVGIATARFPSQVPANPASNSGRLSYQWYEEGVGPLRDGGNIVGSSTTTLTVSNLSSPTDNNRRFYLVVDYVDSGIGTPTPSPGLARTTGTGNAINEPITTVSQLAPVTVLPSIQITSQPTSRAVSIGNNTTFTINSSLTDSSFTSPISYQWYVDDQPVNDGSVTTTITSSTSVFAQQSYDFIGKGTFTIPAGATNISITVAGAKGGSGGSDDVASGGAGGAGRAGTFTFVDPSSAVGKVYRYDTGGIGGDGAPNANQGGGGLGGAGGAAGGRGGSVGPPRRSTGYSGAGGGGGGASVLYDNATSTVLVVAGGGGGGGGGSWDVGGNAGQFSTGFTSGNIASIGSGSNGQTPTVDGGGGGAGGGGAPGGSGGVGGVDRTSASGGGQGGRSAYNSSVLNFNFQGTLNDTLGYVRLRYYGPALRNETVTTTSTYSGSRTNTFRITSNTITSKIVKCVVSHPSAVNSPVTSSTVDYVVFNPRSIINVEEQNTNTQASYTAVLSSQDLALGPFSLNMSSPKVVTIYSPEKDIEVYIDLYGGKGKNNGAYLGGEGGVSTIRLTLLQNTEYTFSSYIRDRESGGSIFFYRKASLIACVGGGGDAGNSGNGGSGGGVNVAGANGTGPGAGSGGILYSPGTLPIDGVYGSYAAVSGQSNTLKPGDTRVSAPNGGRTLPCPKGYWYDLGFAPCADVGNVQFYGSSIPTSNTAVILRGFKSGYGIRNTAGLGLSGGGNGGNGATGGNGGNGGGGGGGGSGYSDGSISIISTQLGGNAGESSFTIRFLL